MKISDAVYAQMRDDIVAVLAAEQLDFVAMDHGDGLKAMWALLSTVSRNRSFDDKHPNFAGGTWTRVLPYDGRDYCWYYAGGCDDTHVRTALSKIKREILAKVSCPFV